MERRLSRSPSAVSPPAMLKRKSSIIADSAEAFGDKEELTFDDFCAVVRTRGR